MVVKLHMAADEFERLFCLQSVASFDRAVRIMVWTLEAGIGAITSEALVLIGS